jgi:tRNA A37 threonylcarbamoyladenosine dehydratase
VCITNVNRQLMATMKTVGMVKVDALKERLLSINPKAEITALQKIFTAETAADFHLEDYDYIIDAIDSLKDKAALILLATNTPSSEGDGGRVRFFSSMGAALKMDPTRIKVAEFWKVQGDPLARALRNRFKKEKTFPRHKFQCVYSDELLKNQLPIDPEGKANGWCSESHQAVLNGRVVTDEGKANGSIVHITAVFGFMLASLVLQDILKKG